MTSLFGFEKGHKFTIRDIVINMDRHLDYATEIVLTSEMASILSREYLDLMYLLNEIDYMYFKNLVNKASLKRKILQRIQSLRPKHVIDISFTNLVAYGSMIEFRISRIRSNLMQVGDYPLYVKPERHAFFVEVMNSG